MADENVQHDTQTAATDGKKVRQPRKKREGTANVEKVKVERAKWSPDAALTAVVESMKDYGRRGDRKACAYIVKMALETRDLCKATRDDGGELDSAPTEDLPVVEDASDGDEHHDGDVDGSEDTDDSSESDDEVDSGD